MEPFSISENMLLLENSLFLTQSRSIVVADLQIGYEQQLRSMGHNVAYEQAGRMLGLLESQIKEHSAEHLIIDGDLKHEFARISGQERRDVLGMLRKLKRKVDIVVVKGNHDTITKPLTDELGIEFLDSYSIDGFLFVHGHESPGEIPKDIHTVVIGHMHPAITLSDGIRAERYKCFLVGRYRGCRLIVLPSFSTMVEGTDVLKGLINTPLLDEKSLLNSMVFVLEEEIMDFGRLGRIKRML